MNKRQVLRDAKRAGKRAGQDAASWVFDGNTDAETFRRFAEGIADGDPEILDRLNPPDLSGEWADAPTPHSLAEDLGVDADADPDGDLTAEISDVWMDAASAAFMSEVERTATEAAFPGTFRHARDRHERRDPECSGRFARTCLVCRSAEENTVRNAEAKAGWDPNP